MMRRSKRWAITLGCFSNRKPSGWKLPDITSQFLWADPPYGSGEIYSELRPRHFAKAAKEESYDDHQIRQTNYKASVCEANAEYVQRGHGKKFSRRFEEERHQGQTRCKEVS
jgi:hypothetical protein